MIGSRNTLAVVALASLAISGCVKLNPDWEPALVDETGAEFGSEPVDMGLSGDGDGDGEGDSEGEGDGEGEGEGDASVCGPATASFGPCPLGCDECFEGVCWRYCTKETCASAFLLCPVSWSCHVACIGKDSCKSATLACTGGGSCSIDCFGDSACNNVAVYCADGPCSATCGGGHDDVCKGLEVKCGTNVTAVRCQDGFLGSPPTLWNQNTGECECSNDCED